MMVLYRQGLMLYLPAGDRICRLFSVAYFCQAVSSDPTHGRVISSSESGGPWGPRSNVDICVWDLSKPDGQRLVASMTVHREHALPSRKPLAMYGPNVAVLTENYVMDLSVNSSTIVRVYDISPALAGDRKATSKSMYRGSLTRGGYSNLNTDFSIIQAVDLTPNRVILASDGSGFNQNVW